MEYIINQKPKQKIIDQTRINEINEKIESNVILTPLERELFLQYYIELSRQKLADYLDIDITENPLINRCDLAQHIVGKLLENNNQIQVYPKESQNVFYPTCKGHSFLICIIQNVPYLVDITYRQFFLKQNCSKENYFIKNNKVLIAPDPGFFMINDEESFQIANALVADGYIELTDLVAKKYGDSFYFTKTGDYNYSDIPGHIYLKNMITENYDYAVNDQKFVEMYGNVMKNNDKKTR